MLKELLKKLENPNKEYRGIPFWSWNDALEKEELIWQIKQMEEAGLGGYFMHARSGLKTPYFSEEWMDCVETCINEGNKANLGAWIYDENGYPSGFAGGAIPSLGIEYQQKFLKFEVAKKSEIKVTLSTLAIYRTSESYERIDINTLEDDETLLHVYFEVNPYYTDLLDESVVRAFIESTYEIYYEKFHEFFGKGMPGIFTDEPQYGRTAMPWSFVLPEKFKKKYNYDINDFMSALYYKTPSYEKVRYDFWNLVAEMFTQGYAKQMGQWCENHNCSMIGHVLLEEDMRYQTMCSGSAMGFYQYMQIPGIDWLGRDIGNPVIGKQISSVALQLDKKLVLSEMFAAAGWNTSFEDLKRIAEWQYSMGINLICAHLEAYSLKGSRKRDHPPGMFYQTPWWGEYRKFNEYFARLGMLLTEGESKTRIVVIHPLRSAWIMMEESCYSGVPNEELKCLDSEFEHISNLLSELHFDYHYGDEDIISKMGSVENGKFIIGKCEYDAVIIPPSISLDEATAKLLKEFIVSGGKVFRFDQFPHLIAGICSEELRMLKDSSMVLQMKATDIDKKLSEIVEKDILILDKNQNHIAKMLHKVTFYDDGKVFFIVNSNSKTNYDTVIGFKGSGICYIVDLENCKFVQIPVREEKEYRFIELQFAPSQSYVILVTDSLDKKPELIGNMLKKTQNVELKNEWNMKLNEYNAITLDYCKVKVNQGEWSQQRPVISIQKELLDLEQSVDIKLEYTVYSKSDFPTERELFLVVEDMKKYSIQVNGICLEQEIAGWWKDKSFRKIDISGSLVKGINSIVLNTCFSNSPETIERIEKAKAFEAEANMLTFDTEIESIYLVGDFIVKSEQGFDAIKKNALVSLGELYLEIPESNSFKGDITSNGYPFYSGSIVLEQEINLTNIDSYKRILFKMNRPNAALSKLKINGNEVKTFLWAPYEIDIKPFAQAGSNNIELELTSTDRNLFGPHHHPNGELSIVGPQQFTDKEGWHDNYCFVKFGIEGNAFLFFEEL